MHGERASIWLMREGAKGAESLTRPETRNAPAWVGCLGRSAGSHPFARAHINIVTGTIIRISRLLSLPFGQCYLPAARFLGSGPSADRPTGMALASRDLIPGDPSHGVSGAKSDRCSLWRRPLASPSHLNRENGQRMVCATASTTAGNEGYTAGVQGLRRRMRRSMPASVLRRPSAW